MNRVYPFEPMVWLTDTLHLDPVTETAYARIQHYYYATGKPVPNDINKLQNISKVEHRDWARVFGELKLLGFYEDKIEGVPVLRHKRIDATLAEMKQKRTDQIERTKAATEARLARRNGNCNEQRNVQRDVQRNEARNEPAKGAPTSDVTKSQLQLQSHSPKGEGKPPILSKIDRISFERELKEINKELGTCAALTEYTQGTRKYNRVKQLLERQNLLRARLGVVA